jgi:hypothetical protein
MAKKKKEQPYRWIHHNMLLQRDVTPWSPGYLIGEGRADALWRTGYGSIAYNGTETGDQFIEGIKSCFKDDGKGGIHVWRYPVDEYNGSFSPVPNPHGLEFDSVSRDQTMMGFVGLAANGRQDLVKKYHSGLKWKLSYFNDQTIDFWLWAKAISGSWFWTQIFWILSTITVPLSIGWNEVLFAIGRINRKRNYDDPVDGYGQVSLDFMDAGYDWKWNKTDDFIYKVHWRFYVYVQFCLQMYVLPKHPLKKFLQWVCKSVRFDNNYFVKLLLGEEVTQEEMDSYEPRYGARWQSRMNITSRAAAKPLKPEHLTDLNYDKDLLYGISRLNKKNK